MFLFLFFLRNISGISIVANATIEHVQHATYYGTWVYLSYITLNMGSNPFNIKRNLFDTLGFFNSTRHFPGCFCRRLRVYSKSKSTLRYCLILLKLETFTNMKYRKIQNDQVNGLLQYIKCVVD